MKEIWGRVENVEKGRRRVRKNSGGWETRVEDWGGSGTK